MTRLAFILWSALCLTLPLAACNECTDERDTLCGKEPGCRCVDETATQCKCECQTSFGQPGGPDQTYIESMDLCEEWGEGVEGCP